LRDVAQATSLNPDA